MTSLLEKAISIIAPHRCISCSKEGNILCDTCFVDVFDEPYDACFLCHKPTTDSQVCQACRRRTVLKHVWMAGTYEGLRRRLIYAYKFERARAAYEPLAAAMLDVLPYFDDAVVVHVPTAPARVRVRGYDHSALLAASIARQRGWAHVTALRRTHNLRQVGAGRSERARQARSAYEIIGARRLAGRHVLLVDDVTTSGATLMAVADVVARAGASEVDAVVIAKHVF